MRRLTGARLLGLLALTLGLAPFAAPAHAAERRDDSRPSVAGAFVYPVGDELDFTKPHAGEASGFYISDSYLVRRGSHGQRTHQGVDLSNGRGGQPVRAIASGVVVVADTKALIRTRRPDTTKVPRIVNGKRVVRTVTKYRRGTTWRTGWGHYVVLRHVLPDGQTVHSLYAHLQSKSILVQRGDVVRAGEVIARVGKTGRASSPHLHLEIRKSLPRSDEDDADDEVQEPTVEDRSFALLATLDPVSFLSHHVRRFDDLDPRGWETPYALAACRDGILLADDDEFEPEASITRGDFYAALAAIFRKGVEAGGSSKRPSFQALRASLVAAGALQGEPSKGEERAGDPIRGSDALEIVLRCLDKAPAQGTSLASFQREQLCRDFNRVFASPELAARAEREARSTARAETAALRHAAQEDEAKALRAAKGSKARSLKKRVKRRPVIAVQPVPRLDYGFEALARSDRALTRAEACLLLASAFRMGQERTSALEQAATRVATASSG